jgi:competence protein ComEA
MKAKSRSSIRIVALGIGAVAVATTIVVSGSQSPGGPSGAPPQPGAAPAASATQHIPGAAPQADDKNAATYTRVCSTCHDAQRILSNRRTKDQWGEVIDKMIERGAQGTDEDFAAVQDYLVSHYGRINVNRGSAADLATVLRIPQKDAEAIVAFRTTNGPFTDFDALAKVPGLDLDTLKQNRDAISF